MDLNRLKPTRLNEDSDEIVSSIKDKAGEIDNPYMKGAMGIGAAYLVGKHLKNRKNKKKNPHQQYPEQSEDLIDFMATRGIKK